MLNRKDKNRIVEELSLSNIGYEIDFKKFDASRDFVYEGFKLTSECYRIVLRGEELLKIFFYINSRGVKVVNNLNDHDINRNLKEIVEYLLEEKHKETKNGKMV